MTAPLTEIMLPGGGVLWSVTKISEYTGIPPHSFTSYVSRGQAPAPTHHVERTRLWDAEAVKTWWANRPGRTGRPRKASR